MACNCGRKSPKVCNDCGRGGSYRRGGIVNKKNYRRFQAGGIRPRGMIRHGSGRIDPTSSDRLPMDDVPAILGYGEYVLNANSVKMLGEKFLDDLNNLGLGNKHSSIRPGTLGHASKYQRGGSTHAGAVRNKVRNLAIIKSRRRR